ncbi:hypothetical protein J5N97_006618 [Dioscorea zingiberensis]|uniref:Uncharacterized protein n=1 Tax=Dioscorea zingiberensis TaxID=325984 RepID=A0A9D5HU70_9LILI|nr:hypothetical protein J5N97_006618 [Dioscorea zingiberensis]
MAQWEVGDQLSAHHVGSCDVNDHVTEHVNVSSSNDEINETLTQPINIYSKSEDTKPTDADDDSDEDYLDPVLERQIELEFDALWNSHWEGDESNHLEGPNNEPTGKEPNRNIPTSPHTDTISDPPGKHATEWPSPSIQSPLCGQKDDSITHNQLDTPISTKSPNSQAHCPINSKGQEIIIPGSLPDIDISNHTWRFIQGSWNFIENSVWKELTASFEHAGEGNQKDALW